MENTFNAGFTFGDTETVDSKDCNLLDKLEDCLGTNSRKFSKVGGRTVSARQKFDQFLNRQRKIINDALEASGGNKISQYDAARRIASQEHKYSERDAFTFGDQLVDIVSAHGRPSLAVIRMALSVLAVDWASDPSNIYATFDELQSIAPEIAAEATEDAIAVD